MCYESIVLLSDAILPNHEITAAAHAAIVCYLICDALPEHNLPLAGREEEAGGGKTYREGTTCTCGTVIGEYNSMEFPKPKDGSV